MKFIIMDDLKKGMRLARPVYSKEGALLYDINAKLNKQAVNSIKNFGLLGVYILEPTEPDQIITPEDREFERFQTVAQFELQKQLETLTLGKDILAVKKLAESIIDEFGSLDHKITVYKSLRSSEDYAYKHSLSVAILCVLMSSALNMSKIEQINIVTAALIHELGRTMVPMSILKKGNELEKKDVQEMERYEHEGYSIIQNNYDIPSLTRIMVGQNYKAIKGTNAPGTKILDGTKILRVADEYDALTSMNISNEPSSDITAVRYLINNRDKFDERAVGALLRSIKILTPGVCVELTNKEKGLVILENNENILRPVVLGFKDNQIYDLSDERTFMKVRIFDILKTTDNRVPIGKESIDMFMKNYSLIME